MNPDSILHKNLLDIIFDNRNKEYGAYVLRRDYNKRLLLSLMGMFAISVTFTVLLLQKTKEPVINIVTSNGKETVIQPPPQFEKKIAHLSLIPLNTKKQKITQDMHPKIVADKLIDNISLAKPFLQSAVIGTITGFQHDNTGDPLPGSNVEPVAGAKSNVITEIKNQIETSPEILPQFPGGLNELIKFLKRNLNTPRDLDKEEEVMVKVKFVVSFNGELTAFAVVQSGGGEFDDEVIRVLKKMPKWIPGKTSGENVSAYFLIPVKFRITD